MRTREVTALALALLLTACGAVGQATLIKREGEQHKPVSAPLALGASLRPNIKLDTHGDAAPTLALISGRPEIIAVDAGRLWARAPGLAPLLIATPDGVVIDFYHLSVERAQRVALQRVDETGKDLGEIQEGIDFVVGESLYLVPRVYADAQQLTGDVSADWTLSSPIADVLRCGFPAQRRLIARAPGEATLRVGVTGVAFELPIRVVSGGTR